MKKVLFIVSLTIMFVSCEKEDEFKIEPNRLLPLKVIDNNPIVEGTWVTKQKRLSAHEFCCNALNFNEAAYGVCEIETEFSFSMGTQWGGNTFNDIQIDTLNNIVYHLAYMIINDDGTGPFLTYDYINSKDIHYRSGINGDTVAYISNKAIRSARIKIDSLFNAKKYEEVYKVYQEAMTIYTCTGAEYKALKERGLN